METATYKTNPYGQKAIDFIESLTLIGDYTGQRVKLDDWQEDIFREVYGSRNPDGTRAKSTVSLWMPRGNAKSQMASWFGGYQLIKGPAGQEIYCASSDKDKASRIYLALAQAIRSNKQLNAVCECSDYFKRIKVPSKNSFLQCLASDQDQGHSYAPSTLILDELHLWRPTSTLYDALITGFQKRKQGSTLEVQISTAGTKREGLAWNLYSYAKNVKHGIIKDPSMVVRIFEKSDEDDWTDPKVWRKCNPGSWINFEAIAAQCEKAKHIKHQEFAFRQLFLGEWIDYRGDDTWLSTEEWQACIDDYTEDDIDPDEPCIAALDLSSVRDLTSLTLFFYETRRVLTYSWLPGSGLADREQRDQVQYRQWEKEGWLRTTSGSRIVHSEVAQDVNEILHKYNVERFVADPYSIHLIIPFLDQEPDKYLQNPGWMSPPCKWLESAVANREISFPNNPLLTWCASNVVVEKDKYENLSPSKSKSRYRIDPVVALCCAIGAWLGGENEQADIDAFYGDKSNFIFSMTDDT